MKRKIAVSSTIEAQSDQIGKGTDQQSISPNVYSIGDYFEITGMMGKQNSWWDIADDLWE